MFDRTNDLHQAKILIIHATKARIISILFKCDICDSTIWLKSHSIFSIFLICDRTIYVLGMISLSRLTVRVIVYDYEISDYYYFTSNGNKCEIYCYT